MNVRDKFALWKSFFRLSFQRSVLVKDFLFACNIPRLDVETRRRVIALRQRGYSVRAIKERLVEECISVSTVSIYSLLKKYETSKSIVDRPRHHFPKKLDEEKLRFMDEALADDDELTARQLLTMLQDRWPCFNRFISYNQACKKGRSWMGKNSS